MIVRFCVGDTLVMKKAHPCGASKMKVLHAGSDIKLRCEGCSHDMIVPRIKLEKNIKQVINGTNNEQ